MNVRLAWWLICVAAAAAVSLAHAPSRRPAGRAPTVIGASSDPVREATAANGAARRFLELYASAADGRLSPPERRAVAAASASQVAELLLDQPPEKLRSGGRIARLSIEPAPGGTFSAVARLSFSGISEVARLTVCRYPDGSWRVTVFDPAVATPNRGIGH